MRKLFLLYFTALFCFAACREDAELVLSESTHTGSKAQHADILGMYVLCEGNMGSNKATLDYLDLSRSDSSTVYLRNIYSERNPSTVMSLGDVGNDCKIYGSRLWLVINCSNKVEVARAADAVRIGKVDIPNCRYVAFSGAYAYVSSYVGPVVVSGDTPRGMVYRVDTLSLQKTDSVVVGYQPEELAVVGQRLYVANSGGYRVPHYDRTVSVVNVATMQEERQIDVAINLHRLKADRHGQLWVTSRGDYFTQESQLYWLAPDSSGAMQVGGMIDTPVSDFCIVGDSLYFYGSQWNEATLTNTVTYGIINTVTHSIVTTRLSSAPEINSIRMPYGIIVNPIGHDFYVMDAKNYVSSGELLHFLPDGTFDWRVWTGDIPAHAAFLFKER